MKEIEMQGENAEMCWLPINRPWFNSLMVIFRRVSACMKFRRSWNSPTIFWRHWNAKACRYRLVLMGANTRGDTPVVSLIAFNDSIRVLSPLCHLVSLQILNHNPHSKTEHLLQTSSILNYKLPVIQVTQSKYLLKLVFVSPRTVCSTGNC